jgi:hypothetical protein
LPSLKGRFLIPTPKTRPVGPELFASATFILAYLQSIDFTQQQEGGGYEKPYLSNRLCVDGNQCRGWRRAG